METRTVLVYRSGSNVGDHNHGDMEARIVSDVQDAQADLSKNETVQDIHGQILHPKLGSPR
eukprot:scaffold23804_cov48-Cyclotella_meneghiniana.AAC.6